MKKFSVLSILVALTIILSSCAAANTAKDEAMSVEPMAPQIEESFKSESFYDGGAGMMDFVVNDSADISFEYSAGSTENGSYVSSDVEVREEKLVYTSNVTLETEDFEAARNTLHSAIEKFGGIIISENAHNLNSKNSSVLRSLYMTVRIPQENYDAFHSGLKEDYNVASISNNVSNMTKYYYDNENRLRSFRIQEERLFAMLEKAETVSDMLEIERRLCDVQYEIESLTNVQNNIDTDVKYATFYLNLHEVTEFTTPAPRTFGDRLSETVTNSAEGFVEFLEDALFTIILLAPYLVIIAIAAVVLIVVIKCKKKKCARKKEESKKDEK